MFVLTRRRTTIAERVRAALVAAHHARRDRALHPLQTQLIRATTVHFSKQAVALKLALHRRTESLNPTRLKEGVVEDFDVVMDELFAAFRPQFTRDLTRIYREGRRAGFAHASDDFGYQLGFMLDHPLAEEWLQRHCADEVRRIDETTRKRLKDIVLAGHRDQSSYTEIARKVVARMEEFAEPRSGPGVRTRAEVIAVHELGEAYEGATFEAGSFLYDKGIPMQKEWSHTGDGKVCPLCTRNAEAGPIPFDQPFPSGHVRPLGHVGCRCSNLVEMDEAAANRVLGQKPKPLPKPKVEPKPAVAPKPAGGKPVSPAHAVALQAARRQKEIADGVARLRDEVFAPNTRRIEVEARLKQIRGEEAGLLGKIASYGKPPKDYTDRLAALRKERSALSNEWLTFKDKPDRQKIDAFLAQQAPTPRAVAIDTSKFSSKGLAELDRLVPGVQDWFARNVRAVDEFRNISGTQVAGWVNQLDTAFHFRSLGDTSWHPEITNRHRAFCDDSTIAWPEHGGHGGASVIVHEQGHATEHQSSLRAENARAFLKARTKGDPLERLKDIFPGSGYDDGEVARKDRFFHPYCGKWYGSDRHQYATEITSMGFQQMFEDPVKFLNDDPDYFAFIVHQMNGVPWVPPSLLKKRLAEPEPTGVRLGKPKLLGVRKP